MPPGTGEFQDLLVHGISVAAVTFVVVNIAKHLWISTKYSGLLACIVATFFVGMIALGEVWPVVDYVADVLILGISVGAISIGLHGSNGGAGQPYSDEEREAKRQFDRAIAAEKVAAIKAAIGPLNPEQRVEEKAEVKAAEQAADAA